MIVPTAASRQTEQQPDVEPAHNSSPRRHRLPRLHSFATLALGRLLMGTVLLEAVLLGSLLAPVLLAQPNSAAERAAEAKANEVVDRYLQGLRSFDVEAMSKLWTEDIVYADPTAGMDMMVGRQEVLAMLRQAMDLFPEVEVKVRQRYLSNNYAVLIVDAGAVYLDGDDGQPAEERVHRVALQATGVIVLKVQGERIAEHRDHIDYASLRDQLEAAQAKRKTGR